jgi:integrase
MEVLRFSKVLLKHWWALMSSAVFTGIGVYAAWRGKTNQWVVTASIAAGAGLRISEILALRVGDCSDSDCWDDSASVIHIRKTRKTQSAERSIPVPAELNSFLRRIVGDRVRGEPLFSLSLNRLYNLLESRDLPSPHAYRRFFSRLREQAGMNANVLKVVMGHSLGDDLTAWYAEVGEDGDFVRAEMDRCLLGFSLPKFAAPQSAERRETAAQSQISLRTFSARSATN